MELILLSARKWIQHFLQFHQVKDVKYKGKMLKNVLIF